MKTRTGAIILLFLMALTTGAQPTPKITGFFTDMHYIAEAGDMFGTEVWIVYVRDRYWACVQMADGAPDPPVVVPVEVTGSRVRFTVVEHPLYPDHTPAPVVPIKFDATATRTGLSGTVASQRLDLKRRNSYWQ